MGLMERLSSLTAKVDRLGAAMGSWERVPESRWGTVTALTPNVVVTFADASTCIVTRVTEAVWVGASVRVQVQGHDRWIVGVEGGPPPSNLVFYATGALIPTGVSVLTGLGFGDVSFTAKPGRLYRIRWRPPMTYGSGTGTMLSTITYTTNGSRPLGVSASLRSDQVTVGIRTDEFTQTPTVEGFFEAVGGVATTYRFLGWLQKLSGGGTLYARAESVNIVQYWTIEDVGLASVVASNTITANNGL